jgi:hypothetical protein
MNADIVYNLLDVALSLALTQLDPGDTEHVLLDIVQKAARAYKDHTGEPLNLALIGEEAPL